MCKVQCGEKACDDMEDRQDWHISLAKIFVIPTIRPISIATSKARDVTKMKIWRQTNLYLVISGDW
eukprot:scaffold3341_cov270-Chaetoceros_neogracile.AAC.11